MGMNRGTDRNDGKGPVRCADLYAGKDTNRGGIVPNGIHPIFVYGSLLPGLENAHYLWPYALSEPVPGTVRGRLVEADGYPALLLAPWSAPPESSVRGLWTQVDRDTLRELDRLEDFFGAEEMNDYDRVWVRDANQVDLAGWTYVWPNARGRPAVSGDWWPDARRRP